MTQGSTQWLLARPLPAGRLRAIAGASPLLTQILHNRGIAGADEVREFLSGPPATVDPVALMGMQAAVARIRLALRRREAIVVYGDFDADGVTATALLLQTLAALGAQVQPYIPDRESEGYGLNVAALRGMAQDGARLAITVDCGMRALEEVAAGAVAGLEFIITDHHTPGDELPPAVAVINPKQAGCDRNAAHLTGVGLAFRLAQALLRAARNDRREVALAERELLDLVALGTVADMASLADAQNRALVREGLRVINEARRPGIRALLQVAGLLRGRVRARDLAFVLGPRVNAAGRLGSAMTACNLLTSTDKAECARLAARLQALNDERRALTHAAQDAIQRELEAQDEVAPLIFAAREDIAPGIVGLVAGRLCDEWGRPAVVVARGARESRASCRSTPRFDITHALDRCAELLVRHGGHARAAGFTARNENLPALRERLTHLAQASQQTQPWQPVLEIDAELRSTALSPALVEELEQLEPTGYGNPPPTLLLRGARIRERRRVGRGGGHLRLVLYADGGERLEAIGFGLGGRAGNLPQLVDLAFRLEMNEWNGRKRLQLNLQDIRPAREG